MSTIESMDVAVALAHLGGDCDEVISILKHKGCRGVPLSGRACPVARYLHNEIGTWYEVYPDGVYKVRSGERVADVPGCVAEFIGLFDSGEVPELVE